MEGLAGWFLLATGNHNPGKRLKHFPRLFLQLLSLTREICKLLVELQRNTLFVSWKLTLISALQSMPKGPNKLKQLSRALQFHLPNCSFTNSTVETPDLHHLPQRHWQLSLGVRHPQASLKETLVATSFGRDRSHRPSLDIYFCLNLNANMETTLMQGKIPRSRPRSGPGIEGIRNTLQEHGPKHPEGEFHTHNPHTNVHKGERSSTTTRASMLGHTVLAAAARSAGLCVCSGFLNEKDAV